MDKISRGVWPTHDTKTSMSPTASEPVAYRLVYLFVIIYMSLCWLLILALEHFFIVSYCNSVGYYNS